MSPFTWTIVWISLFWNDIKFWWIIRFMSSELKFLKWPFLNWACKWWSSFACFVFQTDQTKTDWNSVFHYDAKRFAHQGRCRYSSPFTGSCNATLLLWKTYISSCFSLTGRNPTIILLLLGGQKQKSEKKNQHLFYTRHCWRGSRHLQEWE